MISFYKDSLVEIRHHMSDSIKPYCLPCKKFKKE